MSPTCSNIFSGASGTVASAWDPPVAPPPPPQRTEAAPPPVSCRCCCNDPSNKCASSRMTSRSPSSSADGMELSQHALRLLPAVRPTCRALRRRVHRQCRDRIIIVPRRTRSVHTRRGRPRATRATNNFPTEEPQLRGIYRADLKGASL
uniref:Uncharacterized protein n=1 Tax=Chlamydomonas euryale TaxID=1486919 RepID=A0A7R9V2D6_9CHLO